MPSFREFIVLIIVVPFVVVRFVIQNHFDSRPSLSAGRVDLPLFLRFPKSQPIPA
jgi:hypothetical protein